MDTSVYVYIAIELEVPYRQLVGLLQAQGLSPLIAYAVKSDDVLAVLTQLGEFGSGADMVSEGELLRGVAADIPPGRIVFSGVGKTEGEHRLALELGVRQINIEIREEFYQLVKVADSLGCPAPVVLRINPDVPGRWLVGPAGALLTRALYVKRQVKKRFVIVYAGMNDFIRPALYGAYHSIVPVRNITGAQSLADVVGPVCESSDVFPRDRCLPDALKPGDLVVVLDAGAYGAVMSSAYNSRRFPAAAMVRADHWTLAWRRPSYDELLGLDMDRFACRGLNSLLPLDETLVKADNIVSSVLTEEHGK